MEDYQKLLQEERRKRGLPDSRQLAENCKTSQQSFLKNLDITPPPTDIDRSKMISYIEKGNGSAGNSRDNRIALVRRAEKKWLGKKVKVIGTSASCPQRRVIGLSFRRRADVKAKRRNGKKVGAYLLITRLVDETREVKRSIDPAKVKVTHD